MPYSNRWISSLVVFLAAGGCLFRPRGDKEVSTAYAIMAGLWYSSIVAYAVAVAWWLFIYLTGGI